MQEDKERERIGRDEMEKGVKRGRDKGGTRFKEKKGMRQRYAGG